jgi:hypothetical protein
MVIRKSNTWNSKAATTRSFRALAWVECPGNRRLAFVELPQEPEDIGPVQQRDVIIDGASYFCVDVRTFTPGPHHKGDSVGLLVSIA